MKNVIIFFLLISFFSSKSQDFLGLQSSNYAGIVGAYTNPANIADNRLKFELVLAGVNFNFDNNYVGIKREYLKGNPTKWFQGNTWDSTRKSSNYYWKNNFTLTENNNDKSICLSNRFVLPSFMFQINKKNAIAFNWSVRNYINIDGISPDLAKLAFEEFIYPKLWVTNLNNSNFSVQQMSWAEYGLTYARVLKDDGAHFFKIGATGKLLQGLEAVYLNIENLGYNFTTSDTLSLFKSDVSYGHSANLDPLTKILSENNPTFDKIKSSYKYESYPGFGFDLGFVYEYRPEFEKFKYDMDGKKGLIRKDLNKYKFKASLAVNDIGGIRFRKGALSNDFTADVNLWDLRSIDIKSINGFDSLMTNMFGSKESETTFKMALPSSINAALDFNLWKPFYINVMANISNLQPNKITRVHDFTNISIAPRFDYKWIGITLPVSYNTQTAKRGEPIVLGSMLRLGPLVLGSNNLPGLFTKDLYGANIYFLLKLPLRYRKTKDRDNDAVSDKIDLCKDVPGVWEFKGCPDTDGDHIPDNDDKCPTEPGIKELLGCPDKDGDGITDKEDACPDDKGLLEFNGCPDKDGDKIIDKDDECPNAAGLADFMGCPDKDGDGTPDKYDLCADLFGPYELKGCPDRDGDGIIDKNDKCPEQPGPKENKGCPYLDTDKDGILDKDDACVSVPGVPEYKGCPPPPPLKPAEKKIIERAFASLEFATGKDIIKPVSFSSLNDLANLLKQYEYDWILKLSGHTDNEGGEDKNYILSEKRAKAVKNYLVKRGVWADMIITEWFGQTMPVADNKTAAGRQKNRRVEMKIIYKQ